VALEERPYGLLEGRALEKETSAVREFHVHVYYDPKTRESASRVREGLSRFDVQLGRWHDEPVGPHPKSMYQAAFASEEFGKVVPWLMLNRQGLDVLVHPRTGDGIGDHLERSLWLGSKLKLKVEILRDETT
jgi:DOPA 4,5-dioxygenase